MTTGTEAFVFSRGTFLDRAIRLSAEPRDLIFPTPKRVFRAISVLLSRGTWRPEGTRWPSESQHLRVRGGASLADGTSSRWRLGTGLRSGFC